MLFVIKHKKQTCRIRSSSSTVAIIGYSWLGRKDLNAGYNWRLVVKRGRFGWVLVTIDFTILVVT